jgi:hypothetical protein
MGMNEFRRLSAKIDQHMQHHDAQDVSEIHAYYQSHDRVRA